MSRLPVPLLLAFVFYATLHYALPYAPGHLRMDDFGYLQSVTETLAQGKIRTHDWLEPYSAVTSALSAAAFLVSGNFLLSTWGLQSLFALANLFLLHLLLRPRLQPRAAALVALALAMFPAYWYKAAEFSGNAQSMTFLLLALLAWRRRRNTLFFLSAFLAFANRQNHAALLVLPAFSLVFDRSQTPRARKALAAGLAAFLAAGLLLHFGLNRTAAQSDGILVAAPAAIAKTLFTGLFAALAFLSFLGILLGSRPLRNLRDNFRRPLLPAIATALFLALAVWASFPLISFLTPLIGSLDRHFLLQKLLLAAIPALLWTLDWKLLRWSAPPCLCAAYVAISSLKAYWYDFYLLDAALAALYAVLARPAANEAGGPAGEAEIPGPLAAGPLPTALAAALVAASAAWAWLYRIHTDKQIVANAVYERLERQGRIHPPDMTDATFGFLGWKLFDHYWRTERYDDPANFQCYVRRERVVVETEVPWRRAWKRPVPREAVLEEGPASIGLLDLRYRVLAVNDPVAPAICVRGFVTLDAARYRPKPVPMDGAEWNAFARAARSRPRPPPP